MIYLISFGVPPESSTNPNAVCEALRSMAAVECLDGLWLYSSDESSEAIARSLTDQLMEEDRLLVAPLRPGARYQNLLNPPVAIRLLELAGGSALP